MTSPYVSQTNDVSVVKTSRDVTVAKKKTICMINGHLHGLLEWWSALWRQFVKLFLVYKTYREITVLTCCLLSCFKPIHPSMPRKFCHMGKKTFHLVHCAQKYIHKSSNVSRWNFLNISLFYGKNRNNMSRLYRPSRRRMKLNLVPRRLGHILCHTVWSAECFISLCSLAVNCN